ncbi:MAG TPA: GAF domain-containing protein, partial [Longimicrobiales bacterium]
MTYDPTAAIRDPARLAAVREAHLLEPGMAEAFDRLARLAAEALRAPVTFLSLVAEDREIILGAAGLPGPLPFEREVPISHSFSQHVVARCEPLAVEDARTHPLLRDNPATGLGTIAYLGVPITTPAAHVLGAMCAVHTRPRAWRPAEVRLLQDLAALAATQLDLRARLHNAERLHRQVETILNSAGEGILAVDARGITLFANPAAAKMLRREVDELLGKGIDVSVQHARPDGTPYAPGESPIHLTLTRGETQSVEGDVFHRKDGTTFPVQYVSTPLREAGQAAGAVLTFQDISARRTLEERFRQAQKLEAVGRLAGGVAHDFNNQLTAILGYCDLLLDDPSRIQPWLTEIEEIRKAAHRAAALTRQLLAFSRMQVLQPRILDLNTVVRNMENMLRRLIGEDIEFTTVLDPELGRVRADPGQLEQVI